MLRQEALSPASSQGTPAPLHQPNPPTSNSSEPHQSSSSSSSSSSWPPTYGYDFPYLQRSTWPCGWKMSPDSIILTAKMRREGPSQAYSPNQIRQIKESERIQESLPEKSVLKFLDAEISFFLVLAISSSLYTSRSKDFVPLRNQWIGLRENLLENPEIAWESLWPMVSYRFSLKPIHCRKGKRRKHQEKGMKKYLTHHTMLCGTFGQKLEALILPQIHVNTTC